MKWLQLRKKGIIYIWLALSVLLGCLCLLLAGVEGSANPPTIMEGELDLTEWDFERDGSVYLNGNWAFHWNKLLSEPVVMQEIGGDNSFMPVPAVWNKHIIDGEVLSGQGFATYHLKIKMPENYGRMALKISSMSTAYKIIVNGKVIAESGTVAQEARESTGQFRPEVAFLPEHTGDYDVFVQVSNYLYDRGGMWYPVLLGSEEQLLHKRISGIAQDLFLSGILLVVGLYHVAMCLLRKVNKADLYFGLGCLIVSLRALFTGEMFIVNLFPEIDIHLFEFVEYMTYYWGMFLFSLFIKASYPQIAAALFIKIQFWLTVVFTCFVLFFPMPIYTSSIIGFHLVVLISCLYALSVVFRAALQRQAQALHHMFTIPFFVLTAVHDMLYNAGVMYLFPIPLVPFGLLLFVGSQAFLSALRHSNEYHTIRDMSDKLLSLDQLKDEFLAKTSHELKTPLHGILNISQLMLEGTSGKLNQAQQNNLEIVV